MTKKNTLLLIIIFFIGFFIRFFKVSTYPPLLWDEAALGYNAYSILQTGRDEYGQILPLIFKSFGDYKPGFYVYLCLPFIKFLGLNPIAVRLPSIIFGALLPIFIYLLIKEINPKSHYVALLAAIITAFNPYNIQFSRGSWETNILTCQLVLACFFFYRYLNSQKTKFLIFSATIFGLSLFTYQAGKMISLFLVLTLLSINFSKLNFKKIITSFILPLGIFSLPIIYGLLFNSNANRLKVVSLFSYPRSATETQTIISETNKLDYQIFYSQPMFFIRNFLTRYYNHFSPKFLAFEGDWQNPRHSAPYIGVLLYPSLIFLFIGLFSGFIRQKTDKLNIFFLIWLLLAPIPSALTRDSIQSVRAMSLSIPLVYFVALGIFTFFEKFKSNILKIIVFGAYLISFIYYGDLYLNHMVTKSSYDFLYGYQQAIEFVKQNQTKYQNITFSDFYGQPYIFYLFYSQYPPKTYQQQAKLTDASLDTGKVNSIDNINFSTPSFDTLKQTPHSLGIFSQEEIYRQGIDKKPEFSQFKPLSPIGNISTFYAYENP